MGEFTKKGAFPHAFVGLSTGFETKGEYFCGIYQYICSPKSLEP